MSKNQHTAEEDKPRYRIYNGLIPSTWYSIQPIKTPTQKPRHKLQLNNSFRILLLEDMKFLGLFNMVPYLRIHIKPRQVVKLNNI